MATSTGSRFLAEGGDDTSLALTMFWGSVLEAFRAKTLLWNSLGGDFGVTSETGGPVVASKRVSSGKSWEFPLIGDDPSPEYHTPGVELLGQTINMSKGTINIDDILVSHYDIAGDHTQLSHFDVMAPFARKLGRSLAIDFDSKLFRVAINSALTAAVTNIHSGGNSVTRGGTTVATAYPITATGQDNFLNDVSNLAMEMDDDNVPEDGRYLVINTYIRRLLSTPLSSGNTAIFDGDFNGQRDNSLNPRVIAKISGFNVMSPTTQLPTTNITTGPTAYQGNYTAAATGGGIPVAVALCGADEGTAGVGYVAAADPRFGPIYAYNMYDERRNTTFMKAQMMVGADTLAPWCAGVIQVDDS
jgi:hypothetical protein